MDDAGIYARPLPELDRHAQIGVAGDRLLSVSFPQTPDGEADTDADDPLLDRLLAYFGGESDDFTDVTVALTVPTDRRQVLETLREVPYGDSVTVEQLTRMTAGFDADDRDDQETVRTALTDNPLPVVLPDHRVSDGPSTTPTDVAAALRRLEDV